MPYNKALGHLIMGDTDLNDFLTEINGVIVNYDNAINILKTNIHEMSEENIGRS